MALAVGPLHPDGAHTADAPNSWHRWWDCTLTHHPRPLCDAFIPAALCLFLPTGHNPLSPERTHERRQFYRLVDDWEWRGAWADSSPPDPTPTEQAPDDQVINAVHKLQDRLQQILTLTKRRAHKAGTERATSASKGKDAYAAMEAVISAREWQAEAKRAYDQKFAEAAEAEETYHAAIRRTLEKTEALEKHVKTVTMRADSLALNETDFFQTLIERQEETIRDLNTIYGQLSQLRTTQW